MTATPLWPPRHAMVWPEGQLQVIVGKPSSGPEVLPMKCLPLIAIALLGIAAACSPKPENPAPPTPPADAISPGDSVTPGSWILDPPNPRPR
jgi:hypothetical protein